MKYTRINTNKKGMKRYLFVLFMVIVSSLAYYLLLTLNLINKSKEEVLSNNIVDQGTFVVASPDNSSQENIIIHENGKDQEEIEGNKKAQDENSVIHKKDKGSCGWIFPVDYYVGSKRTYKVEMVNAVYELSLTIEELNGYIYKISETKSVEKEPNTSVYYLFCDGSIIWIANQLYNGYLLRENLKVFFPAKTTPEDVDAFEMYGWQVGGHTHQCSVRERRDVDIFGSYFFDALIAYCSTRSSIENVAQIKQIIIAPGVGIVYMDTTNAKIYITQW